MKHDKWNVFKFGGSSLADSQCYQNVSTITMHGKTTTTRMAVVVSAMKGVTDRLDSLVDLAVEQNPAYIKRAQELKADHLSLIKAISSAAAKSGLEKIIAADIKDILDILKGVWLCQSASVPVRDLILGYGELWSAQVLTAFLKEQTRDVEWLDARKLIMLKARHPQSVVDWEKSRRCLEIELDKRKESVLVIPGFVARLTDNVPATLGRNGSDFSASIVASLLKADSVTIWTDVSGILSADPGRVPSPVYLDTLSYEEAMELAYFGAKVIHPQAISPVVADNIPLWIKNSFDPQAHGTCLHSKEQENALNNGRFSVKGFSTIDDIALVNVEGGGMIGVPGVAQRLFSTLKQAEISVVLISQASSEHSICVAVPSRVGLQAQELLNEAFAYEIQKGQIQTVELIDNLSIIAVVGNNMVRKSGVAATFFSALGKAGINIRAIAQGSSERNISAVIESKEATRALRAVHSGFFLSNQTLSVGIIGHGLVGSALIDQIRTQSAYLKDKLNIDLRIRGICNSRQMLLEENIDLTCWKEAMRANSVKKDLSVFLDFLQADHIPHSVIIDCTADDEIAGMYSSWLERKIHIVTPNKRAGAGSLDYYKRISRLGHKLNTHWLYEATVGAGLPVITTLRDLIRTGDEILRIEGVLSGTLSYIFNSISAGNTFSESVLDAKAKGFTEPDPREDLSGMDVARKVLILAREMGLELSIEDITIQSMIPGGLSATKNAEEFLQRLPEFNQEMLALKEEADRNNKVLRYVGVVDPQGQSEVCIRHYDRSHPFASLNFSDNIIAFTTKRYSQQPLIVQGPGAGAEVTAAGVFADLLRLCASIGFPSILN